MTKPKRSIQESEQPAKVWQVDELSGQLNGITGDISEIKGLIKGLSGVHPTKDELRLELQKRDNNIDSLQKTIAAYSRVLWIVASAFIVLVVGMVWQFITNSGMRS